MGLFSSILGGVLQSKQNRAARKREDELAARSRKDYITFRDDDRRYAEKITAKDREYAERLLLDDRDFQKSLIHSSNKNEAARLANERNYLDRQKTSDRNYLDQKRDEDISQYTSDRTAMQNTSNSLAEKSAASRGIDFVKLRDDAVKAGYNPLTAMSMAHAYSTNIDYQLQGGVYSPGAAYTASGGAYNASAVGAGGGGGGSGAGGMPVSSHVPASGGFSVAGSGYSAQNSPALSAGSFIADALDRKVDTFFNRDEGPDKLSEALRNALGEETFLDAQRDKIVPGNFGKGLTSAEPFRASMTVSAPAMRSDQSQSLQPARMPSGEFNDGGKKAVPVQLPNGKFGQLEGSIARRLDIKPFDTVSAGDWAEIVGEVGEIESAADQPAIRRTSVGQWRSGPRIGAKVRDYMTSGSNGRRIITKPSSRMGEFPGAW